MLKKLFYPLVAFSLILNATLTFTSCSEDVVGEDDPVEEESGTKEDLAAMIMEIYSKASTGPQTVTDVHQLAILTSICAAREVDGPISVTPALLNGKEMTLVTLGGTEDTEGQATTMKESQLAAFGKPNDYLTALVRLFETGKIPQEKPVMVTGISLGGMIAQQLLGQQDILDRYEICAVVTFGSPITLPLDRKGVKLVRFADVNDKVPQLGESLLRSGMITKDQMSKDELHDVLEALDTAEKHAQMSKYTDFIQTHALSYIEDSCWDIYDFFGEKPGTNVLELKEEMKFYPAPKLN